MIPKLPAAEIVFSPKTEQQFASLALDIFAYQYHNNPVYQFFSKSLGRTPDTVQLLTQIPFLPVELFKTHRIVSGDLPSMTIFESSGTTGQLNGKHHVCSPAWYEQSFTQVFHHFYGDPQDYSILALLPSYQEKGNSSLIYMVSKLIQDSQNPLSGFYLRQDDMLLDHLKQSQVSGRKTLLLGVSFALLDLAEQQSGPLGDVILMETGGMKGRREEMTREDLHQRLCHAFQLEKIHSEYGMTELFSQAYSSGNGMFYTPSWMKVLVRDPNDPLTYLPEERSGGLNIIDLANVFSCSFISTQDLGKRHADGGFEVNGRFDNSDVRGCNLLVL